MELYEIKVSNFGPYEKFEFPLYKQGLVWVGGINNDTDAADSNGSGKSSIFKAITWGLYGDSIDGEKGDKVIRDGASKAEVDVRLIDTNGEIWTISRSRSKGSPRVSLFRPDGNPYEGSKVDIQDQILRMVGLDFKSFKNTVLYGQNDSSRFANPQTKDAERKSMLHRILNIELLTLCQKKAGEISKSIKTEIRSLEEKIERAKIICEEQDVSDLEFRFENYEIDKKNRIEKHNNSVVNYRNEAIKAKEKAKEKVEMPDLIRIEKAIEVICERIKIAEDAEEKANYYEDKANKELEIYGMCDVELRTLKKELRTAEEDLNLLGGDKCPVCTSTLRDGEARVHVDKLESNKKFLEEKYENARIKYEEQENKLTIIRKERDVYVSKSRVLNSLHKELRIASLDLAEAKTEVAKIEDRSRRLLDDAKSCIKKAKEVLVEIQRIKDEKNPYSEQLEKARVKVEENTRNISEYGAKIEEKNGILAYYEFWVKGFSNQGLPSFILDSVMPNITERANYYLDTLSDGDITMSFSTQRELKSSKGDMRDEIEIRWEVEGREMYPPSGGQLKKMEIATDLALMDLVASNEGGSLDLLMLDEVLDGLDSEGCSRVLILLQKLRASRGSIFVVSHESKMSEVFEKGIYAVKSGGIASLEKI